MKVYETISKFYNHYDGKKTTQKKYMTQEEYMRDKRAANKKLAGMISIRKTGKTKDVKGFKKFFY